MPIMDWAGPFDEFYKKMCNRMRVSVYKYGSVLDTYNRNVDALKSAEQRIKKYRETGNIEWLIDAANCCLVEAMYPRHRKAHFRATDSDEALGLATRDGKQWHGK